MDDDHKRNYISLKLVNLFAAHNHDHFKDKMNRFEDKHLYGLEYTLKLMNFYAEHYECNVQSMPLDKCSRFGQTLKLLSPLGKCHTYLSSTYANQTLIKSVDISFDSLHTNTPINRFRRFPHYLDKHIYLHERKSFASIYSHSIKTDNIGQLDEIHKLSVTLKKV